MKIPVEAFHAKLLEYWRISGLIRKGRWRRVSAELEDREQLSKDLAELVWLLANVHPIAERYKLISIFIMPKETTTTGM